MIDYENKLNVLSGVTTPPTETIKLYPIKDAYVDQGRPVEPFNLKVLEVGSSTVDDQNAAKSILYFKVPSITSVQYDNLKSVRLVFRSTAPMGRTVNFELRYNAHFSWPEDGTTWLSQPKQGNLIQTRRLEKDDRTLIFDMMELFKAHKNSEFDFPITLLEDPNDGTQERIDFSSKEGPFSLRPTFEIEYEYYPANLDYFDFKGNINVRINVPNNVYDAPDLNGQIDVWGGETFNDLNGTVSTTTYTGDPSDLNGTVKVRRIGWNYFDGQIDVKHDVPNDKEPAPDLNGAVYTKLYKADSRKYCPADPIYLFHEPSADLNGKIQPTTYNADPVDLNGSINVVAQHDFNGQLTIKKYIADSDINSSTDSIEHVEAPDLNGQLITRRVVEPGNEGDTIPDLKGKVEVKLYDNNDQDLNGHLTVCIPVPNELTPAPDLTGVLCVRKYVADDNTDLDREDEKHIPSHNLNGSLNVRPRAELEGEITVKTYNDQKDMNGQINVVGFGDGHLDGKVNVKAYKDLPGSMYSRPRRSVDMEGAIIVGEGENAPFAFIM